MFPSDQTMASTIVKKPKYTLKDVKALAHQLLTSRAHVNNLPILLTFISPKSPPQHVLESLLSVHSFFASVLPDLPSSSRLTHPDSTDAQLIYASWLRSKFDEFVRSLVEILVSEEADEALRELVLDTLMEFVKLGNGGRFNSSIYHKFLAALVNSSATTDFIVDLLASKYFKYIDIRYFTYISLDKLAKNLEPTDVSGGKTKSANGIDESNPRSSIELSIHKMHNIISRIPPLEGKTENSEHELWSSLGFSSKAGESQDLSKPHKTKNKHINSENHTDKILSNARLAKKFKLKFTKAWISFLRLPLPLEVYKEVLVALHQTVIPHLPNPIVLCDFLTRSYDIGGVVSVMALSSLFILMSDHGLEYPNFYEKLYALLLPSIFLAKHRAKFFQLLDICLKSPLLPAYLAAAFAKKLSRLALVVSPSGALVIIALIHNLLRRHPSINCLVHQEDGNGSANDSPGTEKGNAGSMDDSGTGVGISATKRGTDHFDNNESNPAKSHALRSSLWEIDSLRHHYCPPVSRFVLSLENDLTVRAKTTEVDIKDFCSGSYGTIFGQEIRRRVKQVPLAFYKSSPASLFSDSDFVGWTFKYEGEKDGENGLLNIHEGNEVSRTKRQRVEC